MYICMCVTVYHVCIYTFTLTWCLVYISDVMVFLIASSYQKSKQAELRRRHEKIATCVRTPYALETLSPHSPHRACTNTACLMQTPATKIERTNVNRETRCPSRTPGTRDNTHSERLASEVGCVRQCHRYGTKTWKPVFITGITIQPGSEVYTLLSYIFVCGCNEKEREN